MLRRPYSARPGYSADGTTPLSARNGARGVAEVQTQLAPPRAIYPSTARGRSLPPGGVQTTSQAASAWHADAHVTAIASASVAAAAEAAKTSLNNKERAVVPPTTATETFYGRTGGGQYSIPFPPSDAPKRTYRGLQAKEIQPAYITRGGKAECQFTYHRPLPGKQGNYLAGTQYWQHPPDMQYKKHEISETAAKYPRKPRPTSAYMEGSVPRRYGDSGYGLNNVSGTIVDPAQAKASEWSTTYTDMHREVVSSQDFDLGRSQRPRRPHSAHFGLVSKAGKLSGSV